jgi:hypothetical protein
MTVIYLGVLVIYLLVIYLDASLLVRMYVLSNTKRVV